MEITSNKPNKNKIGVISSIGCVLGVFVVRGSESGGGRVGLMVVVGDGCCNVCVLGVGGRDNDVLVAR